LDVRREQAKLFPEPIDPQTPTIDRDGNDSRFVIELGVLSLINLQYSGNEWFSLFTEEWWWWEMKCSALIEVKPLLIGTNANVHVDTS
jgi:hypothetical protein